MSFDSWWFILVAAAALAGLISVGVRLRLIAARRRERELQHTVDLRTRELRSLGSLTERVNTAVRLDEVLEHIWDSFRMVLPYNRIGFAEYDADRETVRAVWARSDASEIMIAAGYEAPLSATSLGRILETGKPRIIGDLAEYLEQRPDSEATKAVVDEGMLSSLTMPLEAMGHKVGFLFFSSQTPNAYTIEHIRLLESISGQLSLTVEKSRLYDHLLDTTRQLEEANRKLERAASTDGLTGVANRRIFDQRLEIEWRRCRRGSQPLSVMMIDIDHFKRFNDRHGHMAGDECLIAVAGVLSNTIVRAADMVARYGGEEFCAILPETTLDDATNFAEELRRRIEEIELDGFAETPRITASVGVATIVPGDGQSPDELIRRADASLYIAKNEGRNLVHPGPELETTGRPLDSDA
jgi:diguanylate cyclase (GGDEF)-like protein